MSSRRPKKQDAAIGFSLIQAEKRSRFDPIRDLQPAKLVQYLDEFRSGHLNNLARVMDAIEERDDVLASVVPKAKSAVARHGWEVLTVKTNSPAEEAEAQRQKETLEEFWNNVTATNALDQDEIGGVSLLLRQMMDAKGKRYAVHNIVWEPLNGKYTATFHFAPLWFFENTTGKMRFINQPFGFYGEDMEPGAWLVTKGAGLMIPCAVAWMYKRLPLRDWLIYCSRHGMPGVEGITDAAEGTAEWEQMVRAVDAAASEFKWVRNRTNEIKTIEFGTQGELPMPKLVERMDRALATIWRGGDLSTLSKDGDAVGSNSQSGESLIIEEDDAAWLTEILQLKVDRLVLDYTHGEDVQALAYIKVLTPKKQNTENDLKVDEVALRVGHPISQKQFAERYNRPLPEADEPLLVAPANPTTPPPTPEEVAANEADQASAFAQAVAADLKPLRDRLAAILAIADENLFREKMQAFIADLENLKADILADPAAARVLEQFAAEAFAGVLKKATSQS